MRGCRARTTKSKERIQRYEALLNQSRPETDEAVQMAAASSRLGKKIIELHDVSKSFDGRPIVSRFSYNLLRNDRIGIVGRNAPGSPPPPPDRRRNWRRDSGAVDMGATVKIGHFSQEGRELDLNHGVYDFIHDIADEVRTDEGTFSANQMMERFLFPGGPPVRAIGRLSAGAAAAVPAVRADGGPQCAAGRAHQRPGRDHPLHFGGLSAGLPGPILAVSHDRFFLDKLAEQIFEVRGERRDRPVHRQLDGLAGQAPEDDAPPPRAEKQKAAPAERPKERRLKFSFKEQREFRDHRRRRLGAERDLAACQAAQETCGSDYVKLQELQARQAELEGRSGGKDGALGVSERAEGADRRSERIGRK